MARKKACFITFEGGDGSGKTTLIDKVYTYLVELGLSVMQTRAPGGTRLGKEIRTLLLDNQAVLSPRAELFLFLADRAQHVNEIIQPALKKGQIVLCDRFNDSTLAYQGKARGFDEKWLKTLLTFACQQVVPQLTIYLDLDPLIGFERTQKGRLIKDRIESETLAFHKKIRTAFRQLAKREPKRISMIPAHLSPEIVFQQTKKIIDDFLDINWK